MTRPRYPRYVPKGRLLNKSTTFKHTKTFECVECGLIQKTDRYEEIAGLKEFVTNCLVCGSQILHTKSFHKPQPVAVIWFAWRPEFQGF